MTDQKIREKQECVRKLLADLESQNVSDLVRHSWAAFGATLLLEIADELKRRIVKKSKQKGGAP